MIGQSNGLSAALSGIFKSNKIAIEQSLARIASGKQVAYPGDDFGGYVRASGLQSDIAEYQIVKHDLTAARGAADLAVKAGDTISSNLVRMRELSELYAAESARPSPDSTVLDSYSSEFSANKAKIDSLVAASYYDGVQIVDSANPIATVHLGPGGSSSVFTAQFAASDIIDTSSLDIADKTTVQAQIRTAAKYTFTAKGFQDTITSHMALTDIIINSKEATSSLITDIDDVRELAQLTDLQVRRQAAAAMMAQANIIQAYAARLYDTPKE